MSVVAMFGLKSPSLLQFDREVRSDGRVRGNLRRAVSGGSGAVRHADADASGPGSGEHLAPGLPAAVPRTAARQDAEAVCGVRPPLSVVRWTARAFLHREPCAASTAASGVTATARSPITIRFWPVRSCIRTVGP